MPEQRFFIGPPQSGLENKYKSWLISDDAYEKLNNLYVWRGVLKKRFGTQLLVDGDQTASRLRAELTPAGLVVTTPSNVAKGQIFSIGSDIFTVTDITAPYPVDLLSTSAVTAQLTAANQVTFSAIASTVYWYPSLPVMGLITFDTASINDEFPIAFDTAYAYKRESSAWERLAVGDATWTGTNSDFFWGENYRAFTADENVLFVTNFVEADGIRYYNDTAINGGAIAAGTWTKADFKYSGNAGSQNIITARLIIYFKDRLLLFNTLEQVSSSPVPFPNRCRFSQNGSPFSTEAWYQAPNAYGKGGFIDAPTTEAIVTAQFLKDRLIVFFERSTYELVYTGNRIQPFIWQKINTELGAESTFSQVPFDNVVLGVGNVGIHACDGASVKRIDDKIPNEVFKVRNPTSGLERVAGIRDYRVEMVYFSFPSEDNIQTFPNRVLVYNYEAGTWAFNDDSITAFGYWQRGTTAESPRWENIDNEWQEMEGSWGVGSQQLKERFVLGGNQEGFTFIINSDENTNCESLQITNFVDSTNVMTVINHNLVNDDFVHISGMTGITSLNDSIFKVNVLTTDTFEILQRTPGSGTYSGGGLISRVSRLEAWTKDFNFFNKDGYNIAINRLECYVDLTKNGEIMIEPIASDSSENLSRLADGSVNAPVLGKSILETKRITTEPFPNKARGWRSVYTSANGESLQFRLRLSDSQMKDDNVRRSGFQLNALILYANRTADR